MPEIEESVLAKVFGDNTFIKVLDVILDHPGLDYSKKELAEAAGISEPTIYNIWSRLEDLNLVEPTRKYGKTQLYKLNEDNELTKRIIEFEEKAMETGPIKEKHPTGTN